MTNYKRKPSKKQSIRFADESKRSGYVNVPTSLLRSPQISSEAKMVYLLLHSYAWQDDHCYPGHKKIAAILNMKDPRTVRGYFQELRNNLLINWDGKSEVNTNIYEILEIPTILLDDSILSKKIIDERINKLKLKHGDAKSPDYRVQKLHPTLGAKNAPLSITHASITHSENFFTESHQDELSSNGKEKEGGLKKQVSSKEKAGLKTASPKEAKSREKYKPLTELEIYELAKEHLVHPIDVKKVSQDAIAEFDAGRIIKPVGTLQTTKHFLAARLNRTDQFGIEVLPKDYLYLIEEAHPFNKSHSRVLSLKREMQSLMAEKQVVKGYLEQLSVGSLKSRPIFLDKYPESEHLKVVGERLKSINEDGKKLVLKYDEELVKYKELAEIYKDRLE